MEVIHPELSLPKKSEVAAFEEAVLRTWSERAIFKKVLEKDSPRGDFISYDGPPFATGLPHYGHILASVLKDTIFRYKTMRGYHVPRTWGWDCHGLPIENIVEKDLGFRHKKDIKKYGIAEFNERCRAQVLTFAHEWEKIIPRTGRWVDMSQAWLTMDKSFMESVWWVFKTLYEKGLIYEDYRVMHICPRCETTLSEQEVSEGYKDVKDLSVTVAFKLSPGQSIATKGISSDEVYLLAWTTTPWTLPGNVALAVGADVSYVAVRLAGKSGLYVVAAKRLESVFKDQVIEIIHNDILGSDLVGLGYEPPFDYYKKNTSLRNHEHGWKICAADFVTDQEGTGIAHEAPAFGGDDWMLGQKENLPFVQHVNMDGTFKAEVADFAGLYVKPSGDTLATDIEIIKRLSEKGALFSKEKITHSYPHCWRCDTPLLNYATASWFVSIVTIKDKLLQNAEDVQWSPQHIKRGRFGKWLEGAHDWSISRQRFWASVIPVWVCQACKQKTVFGSAAELEQASGTSVTDLHKHIVDEIVVPCACGGKMRRVPDVLDTWFDSGSMPYGERHYPFENKEKFTHSFPADFIAEGIDQTRAWFYYLHVIAGAIFDSTAFKNVIVNGIVLAEDGKKMSKKLKNYPDPMNIIETYGADSLRFYLLSSRVTQAEDLAFLEGGVDDILKKNINRIKNVLSFLSLYDTDSLQEIESPHVLDRWVLSRLSELVNDVSEGLEAYRLDAALRPITLFVEDLSTWYLRRSRDRFKVDGTEKQEALSTLRRVLRELSKVVAPVTPFIAEEVYRKAHGELESVHLEAWPSATVVDTELISNMKLVREVVSLGLEKRAAANIKVRQPLAAMMVTWTGAPLDGELSALVQDEMNVKIVRFEALSGELAGAPITVDIDTTLTPELVQEGMLREVVRAVQGLRKLKGLTPSDKAILNVRADSDSLKGLVRSNEDSLINSTALSSVEYVEEGSVDETLTFTEGSLYLSLRV